MNKQQIPPGGFTIIETMIVLAIAGLILMIVLLAIPALSRNARNNQRRQDVQTVLEFVSHYELNNSGDMPADADFTAANPKLTYYDPNNVDIQSSSQVQSSSNHANPNSPDTVNVYNYQRCNGSDGTNAAAGFNDVAALYAVETRTGTLPQCQQL